MIQGSPRTLDRLPGLSVSRVQQSEVFKTMTSTRGPYNWGVSAIGDLLGSPRVAFPFLFVFFSKIVFCSSLRHVIFVFLGATVQVMGKAEGEPARRSHGRGGQGARA